MENRMNLILLLCLFVLSSCSNGMKPSEYVKWIKDSKHGLHKSKQVQNIIVEAQYKPVPYIIANEMRTNEIQSNVFREREKELEGLQYFDIKLSINHPSYDVTNYEVYNEKDKDDRINYLSFGLKNDIYLLQGQDTMRCRLFHFERSYDVTPHRTFVLAFDNTNQKNEDKIVVINTPIFNVGPIKLKFKKEDFNNLPSIKLIP